jgi:ATP phosphoribosyltransferase regulatory subunit
MGKQLRYPTGVRPLLIAESARRRRVESRIASILESAGFDEVILPILDYADPEAASTDTYRFVDRDGELVAVRSDFTPMVARALAPSISADDLPLRVFYRGDVIRYEVSRLGSNRETFQIGAEIVGDPGVEADIEAMALVDSILRQFGVDPLIVFTDATIPDRIGGDGLREALASKQVSETANGLVRKLVAGTATTDDLRCASSLVEVADRLDTIARRGGAGCALHLDDVDRVRGYYTGLRFRAYDKASRRTVAQGGRYDSLYAKFGTAAPAVGFTLTIDDLDSTP